MWLLERLRANKGLELNIAVLQFLGLWPPLCQDNRRYKLKKIFVEFCLFVNTLTIYLYAMAILDNLDDFATVTVVIVGIFSRIVQISKTAICYLGAERFDQLALRVKELAGRRPTNREYKERMAIANNTQWWTNLSIVLTVFAVLEHNCGSGLVRYVSLMYSRKYWFSMWLPFDKYAWPTFELLMTILAVVLFASMAFLFAVDALGGAFLVQITGLLQLLSYDLGHLREDAIERVTSQRRGDQVDLTTVTISKKIEVVHTLSRTGSSIESSIGRVQRLRDPPSEGTLEDDDFQAAVAEEMHRLLGECIVRHQDIIQLYEDETQTYGPMLAVQLVVNVVPSVFAVLLIVNTEFDVTTGTIGSLLFLFCAELFGLCYLEEQLASESEAVREAVYGCDWFDQSESFKRSMRVIMSRCNQPLVPMVAGFVPLTHETFLTIMNLVYSYYMTLSATVHTTS